MLREGKMTESDTFTMAEEFAEVDFNEERLEKRFRKTMETLAKDPRKSIYGSGAKVSRRKSCEYSTPHRRGLAVLCL
jgi:hypothetical protein